ncbi:hypothetical protein Tco_1392193 [Tanacetum coccineum]
MFSEEEPKVVRKNDGAPIIEEWMLDSEEENVSQTKTEKKTVKPSIAKIKFVKPKQQEKPASKTVKQVEKHRQNTHSPRGNQRNWNNMMSQKLGSNFEMFNKAFKYYVLGEMRVDECYNNRNEGIRCLAVDVFACYLVMDALIISISSDPSEESMGSHASRVILFGAIPAIIPVILKVPVPDSIVTPEVGAVSVISPSGVLDLIDSSPSFDSDLSKDSLPPAQICHWFHPFCVLMTRRRTFPLASVVSPLGIRQRSATLIRLGEVIPFGRPYRTHPNGSHKLLTARKRVRSLPARSSLMRSLDHLHPSSRLLVGDVDPHASRTSSTHVSRSIAPTLADLLPPYKRFRDSYSLEDSREEHMEVDTTDVEAVADVGISEGVVAHPEDGVGMGFEIASSDVREDDEEFKAEASTADTREIAVGPLVISDSSESSRGGIPDLEDTIYDIVHYMLEVYINWITEIETT